MLTLRPSTADDLVRPDTAKWLGQTGWAWHYQARSDPVQEHLVDVVGETIVGFCVAAGLRSADRDIELRRIAIAPERRGDGLGRLLLRSIIRRAYESSARRVWLDVKPDNTRARALSIRGV